MIAIVNFNLMTGQPTLISEGGTLGGGGWLISHDRVSHPPAVPRPPQDKPSSGSAKVESQKSGGMGHNMRTWNYF